MKIVVGVGIDSDRDFDLDGVDAHGRTSLQRPVRSGAIARKGLRIRIVIQRFLDATQ